MLFTTQTTRKNILKKYEFSSKIEMLQPLNFHLTPLHALSLCELLNPIALGRELFMVAG
jgi:hypothetical protein